MAILYIFGYKAYRGIRDVPVVLHLDVHSDFVKKSPLELKNHSLKNVPVTSKRFIVQTTIKPVSKEWFSHCSRSFRYFHLITGRISMYARTGNLLFNLFCILALSRDYCYTAILAYDLLKLEQYFEIKNVERNHVFPTNVIVLPERPQTCRIFKPSLYEALDTRKNWTIEGYRQSYKFFQHQEEFLKFSVSFKEDITRRVNVYLQTQNFTTDLLCAIHVRGTDHRERGSLASWYKPFIDKAMMYVQEKIPGVKFIFVTDDKDLSRKTFQSSEVYFSPFQNPGEDLALMSMASHAILTTGTFGWMGAWLGNKGTKATIVYRGDNDDYYPPNWISM